MKNLNNPGASVKIQIDDKIFNSIKEASAFLQMKPNALSAILRNNESNECMVKGFKVKRIGKRNSYMRGCVYCKETGQLFRSAVDLAKAVGDNSCMVNAALKNGLYKDSLGNNWTRISRLEARKLIAEAGKTFNDLKCSVTIKEQLNTLLTAPHINESSVDKESFGDKVIEQYDITVKSIKDLMNELINDNKYEKAGLVLRLLESFNTSLKISE